MKSILLIFALFVGFASNAQDIRAEAKKHTAEVNDVITLKGDQFSLFYDANMLRVRREKVLNTSDFDPTMRQQKTTEMMTEYTERIQEILTPEQYQVYMEKFWPEEN